MEAGSKHSSFVGVLGGEPNGSSGGPVAHDSIILRDKSSGQPRLYDTGRMNLSPSGNGLSIFHLKVRNFVR